MVIMGHQPVKAEWKEIQAHERREQEPQRVPVISQRDAEHHKESGDQPQISFYRHASFLRGGHRLVPADGHWRGLPQRERVLRS